MRNTIEQNFITGTVLSYSSITTTSIVCQHFEHFYIDFKYLPLRSEMPIFLLKLHSLITYVGQNIWHSIKTAGIYFLVTILSNHDNIIIILQTMHDQHLLCHFLTAKGKTDESMCLCMESSCSTIHWGQWRETLITQRETFTVYNLFVSIDAWRALEHICGNQTQRLEWQHNEILTLSITQIDFLYRISNSRCKKVQRKRALAGNEE